MRLRSMRLCAMWLRAMRGLRPAAATCGGRTPDREARIYRAPVRGGLLSGAELRLSAAAPLCGPVWVPACIWTASSVPLGIWRRPGAGSLWTLSLAAGSSQHWYRAVLLRMSCLQNALRPLMGRGETGRTNLGKPGDWMSPVNAGNKLRLITLHGQPREPSD